MRIQLLIFFICSSFSTFSQVFGNLFEKEIMKELKVRRVVEYDPVDSLGFAQKYPNGVYSNYDRHGRLIEYNRYSMSADSINSAMEYRNYYLYDSTDREIGRIQLHDGFSNPFRFITLKSYSQTDSSIQVASLSDSWAVNSSIEFSTEFDGKNKSKTLDTIHINNFHKRVFLDIDSINCIDIFLNINNQVDSTIYTGEVYMNGKGKLKSETRTKYDYFDDGIRKKISKTTYHFRASKELYGKFEYFFFENGLLNEKTTYYTVTNRLNRNKYKYFYFED